MWPDLETSTQNFGMDGINVLFNTKRSMGDESGLPKE